MLLVNGLSRSLHQQSGQVQRQDFKLLIDPALKKGHVKIYRYNGVFEGVRLLSLDETRQTFRRNVTKTFLNLSIVRVRFLSSNHRLSQRIRVPGERGYGVLTKQTYQFLTLRFVFLISI